MESFRKVNQVIEPQLVVEGAGVRLLRSFAPHPSNLYDPFLLFDHFAFNDPVEGPILGFPMHPHRGIETVTYMLTGSVLHRDSLGNSGMIGPGDVQWMTAGGGILHEEMPRRGEDGSIFGFQLWVNLPSSQKMTLPRYQEIKAGTIPGVDFHAGHARVVAGKLQDGTGPIIGISANPVYMEVALDPDSRFSMPVPRDQTVLAYVFEGQGVFGDQQVGSIHMVVFGEGDEIKVDTNADGVRFMLIAGTPFHEPVVPYGPFVMNTRQEIQQALEDLRKGTFVRR